MMRCDSTVWWFDLDMRSRCLLGGGHPGDHADGTRWFTTAGYQQPTCAAENLAGDAADRTAERITEGAA